MSIDQHYYLLFDQHPIPSLPSLHLSLETASYTGKQIRSLAAYSSYVNLVAITPDGQTLVSTSLDGPIELWSLQTGKLLCTLANSSAISIAISPDSQIIASNSADQKIKLWNLDTGELLNTFAGDAAENSKNYNSVTFSPDGKTLISGVVMVRPKFGI